MTTARHERNELNFDSLKKSLHEFFDEMKKLAKKPTVFDTQKTFE